MTESAAAYADAAEKHRPKDFESLARAAHELARTGLKPRDVAAALKVTAEAARRLLEAAETTR